MVTPLEMVDANGDVVTPVTDTITNVNGKVLTFASDTNLAYFQPGDEVQTGVQVVSVDESASSITVDGGEWLGSDGTNSAVRVSKSLRFNSDDSAYLSRTPSSEGNRKTWTWSGWIKRSKIGTNQKIFSASNGNYFALAFNTSDQIQVDSYGTGSNAFYMHTGDSVFRDTSEWYHITAVLNLSLIHI